MDFTNVKYELTHYLVVLHTIHIIKLMKGMKCMYSNFKGYFCPYCFEEAMQYLNKYNASGHNIGFLQPHIEFRDYGPEPFAIDIEDATEDNRNFRTALWTGEHLQLTLMSINIGDEIGLEIHHNTDQFIRVEEGHALIMIGDSRDSLTFRRRLGDDDVAIIPAGKWHNVINIGNEPLKLYSIYAPPEHPRGTIHRTKSDDQH